MVSRSSFILPSLGQTHALFLTKTFIVLVLDMLAFFLISYLERCFLGLLAISITNSGKLVIKKSNLAKISWNWLWFGFQLPNYLVLELTCKYLSCSKQIAWEAIGIWPRLNFSWQRFMHRL